VVKSARVPTTKHASREGRSREHGEQDARNWPHRREDVRSAGLREGRRGAEPRRDPRHRDLNGDIEGEGVVRFLQAVHKNRSASFVGIERVTGSAGGRAGSFLLQDAGTLEGNTVKGEWFVIPA
jgi:Protein of unknown function (DUF3224)